MVVSLSFFFLCVCVCVFVLELNAASLHDTKSFFLNAVVSCSIRASAVLLTCTCINHFHNSTSYIYFDDFANEWAA